MKSLNLVEISRSALRRNFAQCRHLAGNAPLLAMVKADAYGHGMVECSRIFLEEGAVALGVAEVAEGVELREAGFRAPVFILAGVLPQAAGALFDHKLTPVVVDDFSLPELSRQAQLRRVEIGVHLKLDAGMGRQGTLPEAFLTLVKSVQALPGLRLEGVMAHFPMADDRQASSSSEVVAAFAKVVSSVRALVPDNLCLHLANSGGLFYVAGARFDMVRPGIALYGYSPDGPAGKTSGPGQALQPAMRFSTRIIQVRQVPAGTGLGYSHTFVTSRPTAIAVLPVGYEDGYLRSLSNRAQVLIGGRRAPVVGRISMNLTLVDVTGLQPVQPGDEVVLLGSQGSEEISADDIASWMNTISYEVLCLFGRMNRRVFTD